MLCRFEVLTVPSADTATEPIIVLSYDDKKYLFNCGESAQRAITSANVPHKRIKEIFLTSGWQSHGGIAGLLHTIAGANGRADLGIHGPINLAYYLASLRAGHQRDYRSATTIKLAIEEYSTTLPGHYEDSNLIVQPVLSLPSKFSGAQDMLNYSAETTDAERRKVHDVAACVWSGDFLEHKDGIWTAINLPRDAPAAKRISRKRSFSAIATSESPDSMRKDTKSKDMVAASEFKPTHRQYQAFHNFMSEDLPDTFTQYPAAVSYFIQGKARPGKFDPERAKQLGVKPGPDFGRLYQGHPVQSVNQKTVYPKDVMGPPRICPAAILVTCPNTDYIAELCGHPFWKTCVGDKQPNVIMHSCSQRVFSDERYMNWMASFGSQVRHLLSYSEGGPDSITFKKSAKFLEEMRKISTEVYLSHSVSDHFPELPLAKYAHIQVSHTAMQMGFKITPFPKLEISKSFQQPTVAVNEAHAALLRKYDADCAALRARITTLQRERRSVLDPDLELLVLGTGSAGPSNYRNVSGTMILDSGKDGFSTLLDCGESTIGQIRRALGAGTAVAMQALRVIFISHLHADHHLGLIGVIKYWLSQNASNQHKLYIICPLNLGRSVLEYGNIDADLHLHRVVLINSAHLLDDYQQNPKNADSISSRAIHEMKESLPGLCSMRTVEAVHSAYAMCLRIDHKRGWSVAYSGDTRPTSKFSALAQNVTCLVHEATFENGKLDEAVKKRHSTVAEAVEIAREAQAHTTLLTHFSQRYYRHPVLSEDQIASFSDLNIGVAIDLMRVKVNDIWQLGHHLKPQVELTEGLVKLNIKDEIESDPKMFDDLED